MPDPGSIYAVAKYGAECLARYNTDRHYVVRLPTLFGRRRNTSYGFCDKIIQSLTEGRAIHVAFDKIDSPTYTKDAARRILDLIAEKRPFGTYHVANDGMTSYYSLALKIAGIMGFDASNISPAKDVDFKSSAFKPLRTALATIKLPPLRRWEEALLDFIHNDIGGASHHGTQLEENGRSCM